jgi:glycosyltransferase involved in cell wall biosynthesis
VLQVVTDDDRRGAQVFACDLAGGLEALGHDVQTVALGPGQVPGGRLGVEVLGPSRLSFRTLRGLLSAARDADVVIAHGSTTLTAATLTGLGRGSKPFVYRQISDPVFWANSLRRRAQVWVGLRRASHIVALSSQSKEVLRRHVHAPAARISVVPNGVPSSGFRPASPDDRTRARVGFGLDPDRPTLLFIGALVPEKGADAAVAASVGSGSQLLVVGDGPERPSLERLAREQLGDRVRFTGSLNDARPAYCAADVVLLPSRGGDSMPATLIEAGLAALPSVTTPVGAITDVVLDGSTGYVTPIGHDGAFAAAVRRLIDDPDRAARMGEHAREHCLAHFDIDVVARQWERVLLSAAPTG